MTYRSGFLLNCVLALAALIAGGAYLLIGPERLYVRSYGPADLGNIDFANLVRRETPNDALACGDGLCAAKADIAAPVFSMSAPDLFQLVQKALGQEPRLTLMAKEPDRGVLRYVQRSALLRFPDTINIKVAALAEGRATVLLYSRSQIGRGDLGVNRARIERWIGLIAEAAGR
jgi:uncharacterized protein (DUF1499 family)